MQQMRTARRFVLCIHDATPASAHETRVLIRDLAPLVGRRLCFGVVPDWHGDWPLAAHTDYCRLLRDSADELLLHGYHHRRHRGAGPVSWLTNRADEMNGLDPAATRRALENGQRVFADVFGSPARGFLAPAWQAGHVRPANGAAAVDYVLGFFSIESTTGRRVPLATWTWDCGRWRWPGHVGHGIGQLMHARDRRVPVLAIHPADVARGFLPKILRLTVQLLERGYEPSPPAALLEGSSC